MRRRGVHDALQADFLDFDDGPFDTVLSICNGLDKVGTLRDPPRFLNAMRALLATGGQLIVDSFDLPIGADATTQSRSPQRRRRAATSARSIYAFPMAN